MNLLKIGLFNACGIDRCPDELLKVCSDDNVDLILLTETFLTRGKLYCPWKQFHNYAHIPDGCYRGHGGLSFLVRPDLPYHVHPLKVQDRYTLSIQIGPYTIHGLLVTKVNECFALLDISSVFSPNNNGSNSK